MDDMNAVSHRIGLFPGTFDPITNGHLDVIRRGRGLFDELIVAIGTNPEKPQLFTQAERCDMIRSILDEQKLAVRVEAYDGLTVDFAKELGASVILRGIRNFSDLQFEFQLALVNRKTAGIETVWIMAGEEYGYVSSSLIKQVAVSGEIELMGPLLPPLVIEQLKKKQSRLRRYAHSSDAHME